MIEVRLKPQLRATSATNRTYALDADQRDQVAILVALAVWSRTAVADAYGITRRGLGKIVDSREVVNA